MEERNLLIVSDLHLCEGLDPKSGRFSRLEDFLFDDAFARFLRYHQKAREQPRFGGRPWLLIFDGDLFDFFQVVSLPEEGKELCAVKGVAHYRELSINEREYGLGTTAVESEWKLKRMARGHQRFFAALGWFVAHGNHVAVIKGNHDIELYWPEVRERFTTEVGRAYARERLMLDHGPSIASEELLSRMHFYPWFYHEPGWVYVEHGGQYESSSHFPDYLNPVFPGDPERVQLPWGSLFSRYLFNKVEDVHPFEDNVKPPTRYFWWAFRKEPIMTARLLVTRGWIFLRAFWNVAHKKVEAALKKSPERDWSGQLDSFSLPQDVVKQIAALAQRWAGGSRREWIGSVVRGLPSVLVVVLLVLGGLSVLSRQWWAVAVYLIAVMLVHGLRRVLNRNVYTFDDFMLRVARDVEQILHPAHVVRYIVMGHDHQAALERLEQAWYVNTGTWVQVYEKKGPIEGREKLTFFRLAWGYEGTPELLRWDDAAGAPARLMLGLDG